MSGQVHSISKTKHMIVILLVNIQIAGWVNLKQEMSSIWAVQHARNYRRQPTSIKQLENSYIDVH